MKEVMHVDEFIFNYCVSSMISDDIPESSTESSAMNVFSIDENKIRDANGIIFAEAITCYKCTFCGKMFAAMEVVLTHYQSNHRSSVIPFLKGMPKACPPRPNRSGPKSRFTKTVKEPFGPIPKARQNILAQNTVTNETQPLLRDSTKSVKKVYKEDKKFKCHYPGCPKSFSYRIGLENHQKIHKRLKSYKCDWNDCKFKCSDLAGLRFHKNTHSGETPFRCVWPGCSQSFSDGPSKEEHLQKEHIKDKLLECEAMECSAKFVSATERDRHINSIHAMRRTRHNSGSTAPKRLPRTVSYVSGGRVGRPSKNKSITVDITSSEEESESSDEEDNENNTEDNNRVNNLSQSKEGSKGEQPLDLSKTAFQRAFELNLSINNSAIDLTTHTKTAAKRGRKRKKSKDKTIQKTVFRCDYPGCRKTFSGDDLLHEHEKEAHNTLSTDCRSRYERRCKGNLYYKL